MDKVKITLFVGDALAALVVAILIYINAPTMLVVLAMEAGSLLTISALNRVSNRRIPYLPQMYVYAILNIIPIIMIVVLPIQMGVTWLTYLGLSYYLSSNKKNKEVEVMET